MDECRELELNIHLISVQLCEEDSRASLRHSAVHKTNSIAVLHVADDNRPSALN